MKYESQSLLKKKGNSLYVHVPSEICKLLDLKPETPTKLVVNFKKKGEITILLPTEDSSDKN